MANKNYNSIISADGKSFSLTTIMDIVRAQASRYARKKGFSMREEDVENLVGEVFYRVSKYFSTRYDSTKAPVEAWLWSIVYREGSDMLRDIVDQEAFIRGELDDYRHSNDILVAEDVEDVVSAREKEANIQRFLGTLDPKTRKMVQMYREGYKSGDIAEYLGCPSDEVYRKVCRIKKQLCNKSWLR